MKPNDGMEIQMADIIEALNIRDAEMAFWH